MSLWSECWFCYFDRDLSTRWNYRDPESSYAVRSQSPEDRGLEEPPEDEQVGFPSVIYDDTLQCENPSCRNDIMVCHDCAYHKRQVCTGCGGHFCANCMTWPGFQARTSVKLCGACLNVPVQKVTTVVSNSNDLSNEVLEEKKHPVSCKKEKMEVQSTVKEEQAVILVVSDGVHFDYSTKLIGKLGKDKFFVVATQFDYTGWPIGKTKPEGYAIWEKSFDVTQKGHWGEILGTYKPFHAIIFNNPLIGYYFHRIYAKGPNAGMETWEAIHSLNDAWPPYLPSRTDNCYYPYKHSQESGLIVDYRDASSFDEPGKIPWQKCYEPILSTNDSWSTYYNRWAGSYNGRTFKFGVHYKRTLSSKELPRGFQWFVLNAYFWLGQKCLESGGTIEVNTPAVIGRELTEIGFKKSGGFLSGPYGQSFAVELTHYGWHVSWPMFDHVDPENGPQDGDVSDMGRYVFTAS